jgi:hypothetical protein
VTTDVLARIVDTRRSGFSPAFLHWKEVGEMARSSNNDNLFRPVPATPLSKAELTDKSRAIILTEADSRETKTQRLPEARLQMAVWQPKPASANGRYKRAG